MEHVKHYLITLFSPRMHCKFSTNKMSITIFKIKTKLFKIISTNKKKKWVFVLKN